MTLQIGRIAFDGDVWTSQLGQSGQSLSLSGEQQVASLGATGQDFRRQLRAMTGQTVPMSWPESPIEEGWWTVNGASADISRPTFVEWSVDLSRVGSESESEFESHLVGADLRNDHGLTGRRFHAAPVAAYAYRVGGTLPSTIVRVGEDGNVTTHLDVGDVNPVWSVAPSGWYAGAATVTVSGRVVAGREAPNTPRDWQIDNSLVRVTPGVDGSIDVGCWDPQTAGWVDKTFDFRINGGRVPSWEAVAVLHNTPAQVGIRLTRPTMTLDLSVRRGSRFVIGTIKRDVASDIKIERITAEAATVFTGGIHATSNDANGNRYVIGTAQSHTADTAQGGIEKTDTSSFSWMVGYEINGTTAQAGDTASDMMAQHIGYVAETVRPVLR